MLQVANLSEAGCRIVENFFSGESLSLTKKRKELMVSLYAMMDDANSDVLNILGDYVANLSDFFSKEDIDILRAEYPAVVKYCLIKSDPWRDSVYYVDQKGYTNKELLPKSLLSLCLEIVKPDEGENVFLPYAGLAQLAYEMPNCKYYGFEENKDRWAFSQILLHASAISSSIIPTDNMQKAMPEGKLYDFIFSMPPFATGKNGRNVVNNIYQLATKYLKENGAMCCILPMSFCYESTGWYDVRKILMDYPNRYSVIVITLPRLEQLFSATPLCIFILVKNGEGIVSLMDASLSGSFCVMHNVGGYKEYDLNVESILATYKNGSEDYTWEGKAEWLNKDMDLTPSRYLVKNYFPHPRRGEELKAIGDLIEIIPTERIGQKVNTLPLLGTKELSTNYLNCDIPFDAVPQKKIQISRALTKNCLLAGFIGGKFKVGRTIDLSSEQFVALRTEVIPFRLKSDAIIEEYLLRSIMSENVNLQGRMLATGVTISRIKKQDFLDLQIIVPSIEEQRRLAIADTKQSLTDADIKLKETYEEFRRDVHMQKHAIGQTIFTISNWWDTLQQVREENNGIVRDDTEIGKIRKIKVSSIYENLQRALGQLQQQIDRFDRANGLIVENFALTEFIENYIARKESPLYRFEYVATSHHASQTIYDIDFYEEISEKAETDKVVIKQGAPIEYVNFSPDALEMIFDNIVSNACCHGFKGRESEDNIIKIDLQSEGDNYVVIVSNNGAAMNKQFNPSEVFLYGKSSKMGKFGNNGEIHSGIGGFEIKKLMKEFGGEAEFISNPDSFFPISYKLTFYNTNIERVF